MAEAVFRHMVRKEGLEPYFDIDSAGLGGWHTGEGPHRGTRKILDRLGISYEGIFARQITAEDLNTFDYILGMDDGNMEGLRNLAGGTSGHVARLLDFVEDAREKEIPDPYYTGDFETTYRLVSKGCRALLETIKREKLLI
jgi:Low molecular weight phosphotyrosine protein phosphatase.